MVADPFDATPGWRFKCMRNSRTDASVMLAGPVALLKVKNRMM
jgi:hypothetical protein